jgi:hypothetical protein
MMDDPARGVHDPSRYRRRDELVTPLGSSRQQARRLGGGLQLDLWIESKLALQAGFVITRRWVLTRYRGHAVYLPGEAFCTTTQRGFP